MKKEDDGIAKEWEQKAREEHQKRIAFIRKKNPDIRKWSQANFYRNLCVRWLKPLIVVWVCFGLVFASAFFVSLPKTSFEPTKIDDIAKSIIAPSITVNGLFTSILPVIGFFYVTETSEKRKDGEQEINEQIDELIKNNVEESNEEDLKLLNENLKLVHAFWENLRIGVLKYIATCLAVSVFSLLSLLLLYIFLSSAQFIIFDILLLSTVLTGIIPIIQFALIRTPSKV